MKLPTLTISARSGWLDQKERFSANIAGSEQQNYTLLSKGQLSYNHGNSKFAKYGAVFELRDYKEALVPRVYHSFRCTIESKPAFLEYLFVTKKPDRELVKLISSGARMDGLLNINYDDFMGIKITIPEVDEQIRIGSFFSTLDNLIAFHQRKLELMKQMKKGLLQKIFCQELRFEGFDEEWELHQFGDLVDKIKSYSLSRDIESSSLTEYQYIHYGDIHTKVADIIDENTDLPYIKGEGYELLQQNDLIVADASEDYEGIAEPAVIKELANRKIVAGLHTIALRPKETDSVFLYYLLHTRQFKEYGSKAGTGMKVFGISFPNLAKFEAKIPPLEEQLEIGDFFLNLDKQINLRSQKYILLQKLKNSLLQQMFI
jgi:type I restriction enzyme S subunit